MRLSPANPMVPVLRLLLVFEVVVFALAVPGMVSVSNLPVGFSIGLGVVAMLLAIAAAGLLKRPVGFWLGWASQVAALALGLATPWMFAAGGIFVALWITCVVLGRRLPPDAGASSTSPSTKV